MKKPLQVSNQLNQAGPLADRQVCNVYLNSVHIVIVALQNCKTERGLHDEACVRYVLEHRS